MSVLAGALASSCSSSDPTSAASSPDADLDAPVTYATGSASLASNLVSVGITADGMAAIGSRLRMTPLPALQLVGWGHPTSFVDDARPRSLSSTADEIRLAYGSGIELRYGRSSASGDAIEQTFTIAGPPPEPSGLHVVDTRIVIDLLVPAPARVRWPKGTSRVVIEDEHGVERALVTSIVATDAAGTSLPAHFEQVGDVRGSRIRIVVDASGAQGIITVDPTIWEAAVYVPPGLPGWDSTVTGLSADTGVVAAGGTGSSPCGAVTLLTTSKTHGAWFELGAVPLSKAACDPTGTYPMPIGAQGTFAVRGTRLAVALPQGGTKSGASLLPPLIDVYDFFDSLVRVDEIVAPSTCATFGSPLAYDGATLVARCTTSTGASSLLVYAWPASATTAVLTQSLDATKLGLNPGWLTGLANGLLVVADANPPTQSVVLQPSAAGVYAVAAPVSAVTPFVPMHGAGTFLPYVDPTTAKAQTTIDVGVLHAGTVSSSFTIPLPSDWGPPGTGSGYKNFDFAETVFATVDPQTDRALIYATTATTASLVTTLEGIDLQGGGKLGVVAVDPTEVAIDASGYVTDPLNFPGKGFVIIETLGSSQPNTCGATNACPTGFCVDGQCCDTACTRDCQACDVVGHEGTCTNVAGNPHGTRLCGTAECGTLTCLGSSPDCQVQLVPPATCDPMVCGLIDLGGGTCQSDGHCALPCEPYGMVCKPGGTFTCRTVCGTCSTGYVCNAASHKCEALAPDGTACPTTPNCLSGNCADGVCCDRPCTGPCESCSLPGSIGTCTTVLGAPAPGHPDPAIDVQCIGVCDGIDPHSLVYPGPSTVCAAAKCVAGVGYDVSACDFHGACTHASHPCTPYVCGSVACKTSCAGDADCISADYCAVPKCVPKKTDGQTCGGGHECVSGLCVDGVCCDTACNGQCEACNNAGSVGTCSGVNGAPVGGRIACASDGSACGGKCISTLRSACFYAGSAVECRTPSCTGATLNQAAFCNGTGSCPASTPIGCVPFACNGASCASHCAKNGDCAGGFVCDVASGNCILPGGDGGVSDGGDAGPPVCGDGRRAGIEECNFVASGGAAVPACTNACEVADFLAVPVAAGFPERTLGGGAHPIGATPGTYLVSVVEPEASPIRLAVHAYDRFGWPTGSPIVLAQDAATLQASAPSVATLADGRVVAVWTDDAIASGSGGDTHVGDGDGLGVVARWFDPSTGATSSWVRGTTTTFGAQYDADVVVAGNRIVIAWTDDSAIATNGHDVRFQLFDTSLAPIPDAAGAVADRSFGTTTDAESKVVLAANGSNWIAVWRAESSTASQIRAQDAVGNTYAIALAASGPFDARPVVAALDAGRWLVVTVEGTPPGDGGLSGATRLRYAILSDAAPGTTTSFVLPTSDVKSTGTPSSPALVAAGGELYVAWHAHGADDDLYLRLLSWNSATSTLDTSSAALTVPRLAAHVAGDQRSAALTWIPSEGGADGGALGLAWEDLRRVLGPAAEADLDVLLQIAPLPVERTGP
ncbi:MAG: hypothetical protein ACHREM_10500 [Polyangiales bacterium]